MPFEKISLLCCSCLLVLSAIAQREVVPGWHLLDKQTDGYNGISLQKAYQHLAGKKAEKVIVAVLDGGTDTLHEDLRPVLWRNPKEIAGNKLDDDHNGYVDDVFGWNFLGNETGENVEEEISEAARIYNELKPFFESVPACDTSKFCDSTYQVYKLWKEAGKMLEVSPEDLMTLRLVQATSKVAHRYDSILCGEWQRKEFTMQDLEAFKPEGNDARKAKMGFLKFMNLLQFDSDITNTEMFDQIGEFISRQEQLISAKQTPTASFRYRIVNDDPNKMDTRPYGNADVMAGNPLHGTHVAGIIAAERNNRVGIEGVANNVCIMTVRVVPKGDEHDKDVAMGIRYAVNNGAKVINMSFGKEISPRKGWVDDAIRYAASKDVLIVHAAGNDGLNIDEKRSYPSPLLNDQTLATNMITVGASGDSSLKTGIVADFTNFGEQFVDLLAPGVKIYSSVPNNKYAYEKGTSMAAPIVSGVAALIRGYYPTLTATEVKQVIEESVDVSYQQSLLPRPGGEKSGKLPLAKLCRTGGIVNAYNAVLLAEKIEQSKKHPKLGTGKTPN
jgi:subtilisin family serine protease